MAGSTDRTGVGPTTSTTAFSSDTGSTDSSSNSATAFGQRTVRTHGSPPSALSSSTDAGDSTGSSFSTDLTDRTVAHSTPAGATATLPPRGTVPLANGGQIIFERVNDGSLPTAKDDLLKQIHELESTGKIDGGSASKVEKFFSGASKVLDFFMHNKKFQTAIGLIGCAVFIGGGVVCPVLLIGVGPCVLVFANGFIDNPMLTAPEGPAKSGAAPDASKAADADKDKGKDKDNPKTKTKGGGVPKKPDSDDDDPQLPPAGGANPLRREDPRKKDDDDDDVTPAGVANTVVKTFRSAGTEVDPLLLSNLNGTSGTPNLQSLTLPGGVSQRERAEVSDFATDQRAYIKRQLLDGEKLKLEAVSDEGIDNIQEDIFNRANRVAHEYMLKKIPRNSGVGPGNYMPTPADLAVIKNAMTRSIIDELVLYAKNNGSIPKWRDELRNAHLTNKELVERAGHRIGLPVSDNSPRSLVHRILGGDIYNFKKPLDAWCEAVGIPLGT